MEIKRQTPVALNEKMDAFTSGLETQLEQLANLKNDMVMNQRYDQASTYQKIERLLEECKEMSARVERL